MSGPIYHTISLSLEAKYVRKSLISSGNSLLVSIELQLIEQLHQDPQAKQLLLQEPEQCIDAYCGMAAAMKFSKKQTLCELRSQEREHKI